MHHKSISSAALKPAESSTPQSLLSFTTRTGILVSNTNQQVDVFVQECFLQSDRNRMVQ